LPFKSLISGEILIGEDMSEPTNAGKALGAAIKEASLSVPIVGDDYDGTRGWSQEDFAKYQEAVFDAMGEAIVSFIRDNLQVYGLPPLPIYAGPIASLGLPPLVPTNPPSTTGIVFVQDLGA